MQPTFLPLQQPVISRRVQFGGPLEALSNVIGVIDSNRIIELTSTDIIGMCFPRTAIEAKKRGPDAARETAIRELSGLVGNMFLVGWFSKLFLKMLGNRVNRYNPHGIPASAWMNIENMQAFGKIYEAILRDPGTKNAQQARAKFVRAVLSGLESADKHLGANALLDAAKVLDGEVRDKYLQEIQKNAAEGRLPKEVLERLAGFFDLRDSRAAADVAGTVNFNQKARELVAAAEKHHQRQGLAGAFDAAQAFVKTRLRLSLDELRSAEDEFARLVDREALGGYLSKEVNLVHNGEVLTGGKSRDAILRQLKHFLEQYVDRAAEGAAGKGWQDAVLEKLLGQSKNTGFLARFVPQIDDGLMQAARKSKWAYTWVPVLMAICSSISVAFYNNWLTRKKMGGKNISPYELGLAQKMGKADALMGSQSAVPAGKPQAQTVPGVFVMPTATNPAAHGTGLRRPQGAFAQFQNGRTMHAGGPTA